MKQSSWMSAQRASTTLTASGTFALVAAVLLARALHAPEVADVLAGAALAPLLSLVTVLALRGSEPLRAGRFLLRLAVARALGALVAGVLAALLHEWFGLPWTPLVEGFALAVLLGIALHPWAVHAALRRTSCRTVP